ncbi:MAG: demethoxyubiquinone hydroxylase family protein [Halieaceae bacterium]|jgi:ubiquinone biosynthesis monooxygenase Coq7|nr:demethoxyubiquinone hydroxylase family protein [Halieaceae bacterium]
MHHTHDYLPSAAGLPVWLQRELRSDHAGETGAVWIYLGILQFSRDPDIRSFAEEHLQTEQQHLSIFAAWMPKKLTSLLLPLWRLSGWMLGALSVLGGRRAVFATIEAVETFVVAHYQQQIERLAREQIYPDIATVLKQCMDDEAHHRDDAAKRYLGHPSTLLRAWQGVVGGGSALAVVAARRV